MSTLAIMVYLLVVGVPVFLVLAFILLALIWGKT
jgi:hypothetical protein